MTTQWILDRLETALDDASTVPVQCLAPDEVGEWNDRVHRLRIRADAVAVDAAATADVVNLGGTIHRGSTAAFLAVRANAETKSVRADIKLGHWLVAYPVITAAFRAGALGRAHIRLIRQAENRRTEPYLADAQEYLVQAAQACTWPEFVQVIRYRMLAFDPDGEEPSEQVAERWFRYAKHTDGTVAGSAPGPTPAGPVSLALEAADFPSEVDRHRLRRHDRATHRRPGSKQTMSWPGAAVAGRPWPMARSSVDPTTR